MTIERIGERAGVNVQLDPEECELFLKLARDAAKTTYSDAAPTYFAVCLKLGQRLTAIMDESPGHRVRDARPLADRMVALILGENDLCE